MRLTCRASLVLCQANHIPRSLSTVAMIGMPWPDFANNVLLDLLLTWYCLPFPESAEVFAQNYLVLFRDTPVSWPSQMI